MTMRYDADTCEFTTHSSRTWPNRVAYRGRHFGELDRRLLTDFKDIRTHRRPANPIVRKLTMASLVAVTSVGALAGPSNAHDVQQKPPGTATASGTATSGAISPTPEPEEPLPPPGPVTGLTSAPTIAAVTWVQPVQNFRITSCFGPRRGRIHHGIDMALPTGKPIRAVGAGEVIQAGWRYRGYGYTVAVRHSDGYVSFYAHASAVLVERGQQIAPGQVVARVGSTGHTTGPHLHFGVIKGSTVDFRSTTNPGPWLKARGIGIPRC